MPDVIQLLSDHIANQIAAGEVIQRPGSAVKELLENSIDAGATEIQLIVKDAGKELIQVVDNGKGMSTTDARMSFERHATSKIKSIDDLFTIKTMGFRGEALASIAAVAQVEMRTKLQEAEIGTKLIIEGTQVLVQEPCACNTGTNLMIKNLFYNVPARRHFLKSNTTEFKYLVDEFLRVAIAFPSIAFRLWHNGVEQFHLDSGNLKTRIVSILGNNYEKKLVPVNQDTEILKIYGFIGKPEAAIRTRGNQYFFVNGRFIKNQYLNHAVVSGFESLIEKDTFPFYVLFIDVDPSRVDVNVHPTKQEVKFEDDRMIYAFLLSAIKHTLASNNIAPSLDFTLNPEITKLAAVNLPQTQKNRDDTKDGYLYSVFSSRNQAHVVEKRDSLKQWKELYEIAKNTEVKQDNNLTVPFVNQQTIQSSIIETEPEDKELHYNNHKLVIHGTYLATNIKSGLMLIHIIRAQERIWYERLWNSWERQNAASQRILFPSTYQYPPHLAILLIEVLPQLARIGLDISPAGKDSFVVNGIPSGMESGEEKNVIDDIIDHLQYETQDMTDKRTEYILIRIANRFARNKHAIAHPEGQQALIDELFACNQPEYSPTGKKVFTILKTEELEGMLE